jgi:hypothetical protein
MWVMKWSAAGRRASATGRAGVDRVAGAHHDDVAAAGLDRSDALGHVQGLTDGVTVPRCVRAGCEVHGVGAHAGRPFAL